MIEALEDRRRDWRHAYHSRILDTRTHLERERAQGHISLSDREIWERAQAQAEREVNTAINMHNERAGRFRVTRNAPLVDETIELPPIHSSRDFDDKGILVPVGDY